MNATKIIVALLLLGIVILSCGCLKKSKTDERVMTRVNEFLAKPYDPSDQYSLKPEEVAALKGFQVYRNEITITLVDDTPQEMWEPIGRKVTRAFGLANREYGLLDPFFNGVLWVSTLVDNERDNFKVGDFKMQNSSDRITVSLYRPTKSKK